MEKVGDRIERIRNDLKLSKAQFGKLIGVSAQYIGIIEKRSCLSANMTMKICRITGVSADYLLFGVINPIQSIIEASELSGLSYEQILISLDIIKKIAKFINTENGNEILIQEVVRQQKLYLTHYNGTE